MGNFSTSSNEDVAAAAFAMPPGGLRYVRIQRSAGTPRLWIDAAEVEDWDCQSVLPVAGDDEVSTPEDVPLVIRVLDNDASPSGSPLSITAIISPPSFGQVSINPNGTVTYLNNTDVNGTDMFS
ncbi:Ig-like domain-containing protein, partial [Arthrospira platensis SPKY1]|nr:Ig-like domain-containing protein [Arthrospira platensis SPKY1]